MNFEKVFLILYGKVFALLGFPLMTWLWYREHGAAFAILIMGLPLIFGYVVPGIGTNILKIWRFRDSWVVGDYYIHHGFIYASGLSLGLYLGIVPIQDGGAWTTLTNIVRPAAIIGLVGWWHDLIAIRQGVLELHSRAWQEGAGPEVIATQYAPLCFSLFGAIYAGIALWGYELVIEQRHVNAIWWLLPLGLVLMAFATMAPLLKKNYL